MTTPNVTCECGNAPREIIEQEDEVGVKWWTLANLCSRCLEATALDTGLQQQPNVMTVAPATRDIEVVCSSVEIVRDELKFHVARLKQRTPDTAEESKKNRHLILDYLRAEETLGRLYGYQMTRLERRNAFGSTAPNRDSSIDERGVSTPVVHEERVYTPDPRD